MNRYILLFILRYALFLTIGYTAKRSGAIIVIKKMVSLSFTSGLLRLEIICLKEYTGVIWPLKHR